MRSLSRKFVCREYAVYTATAPTVERTCDTGHKHSSV